MSTRLSSRATGLLTEVDALDALTDEHRDVVRLLDRCAVLQETSRRVREQLGFDLGYAASMDAPDLLVIRGWSGATGGELRNLEVPRGLGLGGKSFALARPMWVPDYCGSAEITHEFDSVIRSEGIRAMAAVPIVYDGDVLGVVYAAQRETVEVGDTTLERMAALAEPTATALHLVGRMEGETTAALTAERQRIVVALHDSVGAMLFSLGAEVRDLQSDAVAAPELQARLRDVERRIAETTAVFRESLAVLDAVGPEQALTAVLRGDCDAFAARSGVTARCVALTDVPALDRPRVDTVVAVVREALVNVEKHAAATSVVVSVAASGDGLAVAVADDGLGWCEAAEQAAATCRSDHAVNENSTGIGLRAAHDRLARLGGTLSVVGNEDGGITMRAWIPLS